jgi:two-component system response regulator FixJ
MTNVPAPPTYRRLVTIADERLAELCARGRVVLIDDDFEILAALKALIELHDYACECYSSALGYLEVLKCNAPRFPGPCCVLCDVKMPGLDGLELQHHLALLDDAPLVLMSGASGAQEAAQAFRAGALNFLVKPIDADTLLTAVAEALLVSTKRQQQHLRQSALATRIATLSARERDIVQRVAAGQTNPVIAKELGIALRTVKLHRQHAMAKVGAGGTAELVRIASEGGL